MKVLFVLFATMVVASSGFDLKWLSFPIGPVATTTTTRAPVATTTTTRAPVATTTTTRAPVATTTTTRAPVAPVVTASPVRIGQLPAGTMDALNNIFNAYPALAGFRDVIINQQPAPIQYSMTGSLFTLSQPLKDMVTILQNYDASRPAGSPFDFTTTVNAFTITG